MRKYLIMTLLASTIATQAFAADGQRRPRGGNNDSSQSSNDDGRGRSARPSSARDSGGDDGQRAARFEARRARAEAAPAGNDGAHYQQAQQQPEQAQPQRLRQSEGRHRDPGAVTADAAPVRAQATATSPFQERLREYRAARGGAQGEARSTAGTRAPGIAGGPRGGFLSGRVATAPRGGAIQVASKPDKQWYANWRAQRQYDWQRHRERNRDHYHLGNYWDPYGYQYRRWQIGWMLWPSYYQDSYWLNDAYSWRLPPVYGPYRWVRYWDDALLVNIYSGQVVDVIYNVFW